jgi:cyclophilin family peptidyl-prolyl cis-trans isomerase
MAKTSAPDTGGSQFFIIPEDSTPSHLNGVHTVFGEVTEGCEHITTISEVATGDNDRPILPVVIYSATLDN